MKTKDQLEEQTSSVMRFLEGEEVRVCLDWDSSRYYVWMEPTWNFESFCEDNGLSVLLDGLKYELTRIGVQTFCDLDGVNSFCARCCGDDEPAEFIYDELYETVEGV